MLDSLSLMRRKRMRKTTLFATALIAFVALLGLYPAVSARPPPPGGIYYGYGETTDDIGQVFRVWITVDTRWNKITVRWEGHAVSVKWGFPGGLFGVGVSVWDDKGYSDGETETGKWYGTTTFLGYGNSYTWAYARVSWNYVGAFWFFAIPCTAAVYVER